MVKAFAIFLADTFLVLQMPINILPLNKHSSDTVPNTPDANCETVRFNCRDCKVYAEVFKEKYANNFFEE